MLFRLRGWIHVNQTAWMHVIQTAWMHAPATELF